MTRFGFRVEHSWWLRLALAVFLFATALLPRLVYPVSRPAQWYTRSVQFISDVSRGAWGNTIYSEHPGVTTMWLSGSALWIAGVRPEEGADGAFVDPASLTARKSAIGVLPLALTIAGLILVTYGLLARLLGRIAALCAALLVALDPFLIANSKVLHVDGLLAAFMIASALALLVYLREKRWRWLVLSGVLGGLALLTKSPALFLVPYAALCLGTGVLTGHDGVVGWRREALAGLAWLAIVCLVYFALYPAMWVDPLGTPRIVYGWAAQRLAWAHPSPLYFLGQPIVGDPGPAYYLVAWGCKLTALVSVFGLVGSLAVLFDRRYSRQERVTVGLVFAFAFFFTLQMMIGAKKMPRYLLPAFPVVDIIAGLGLVWWAGRITGAGAKAPQRKPRGSDQQARATFILTVALCLLLQAALVFPHHPYYGAHFNELVGSRAGVWALATQWQGEGLDIAARMLNAVPGAGGQVVGSHMPTMFGQYFVGRTVSVDDPADWVVFGINNAMRDEGTESGAAWDFYRRRQPWATVRLNGQPYVWAYSLAGGPQNAVSATFEPGIWLIGYDIAPLPYHAGRQLRLQLYWQAEARPTEDYTVFVHVLDGAGQLVVQQDNPPVRGTAPTSAWEPGAVVVDPYDLLLPENTPPGELVLKVGLYRWPDGQRLPVRTADGEPLPDDQVVLAALRVTEEAPSPALWIARGLGCLVVLSALIGLAKRKKDTTHIPRRME